MISVLPILAILSISVLPSIYTRANLAIGGDVMIPLTSSSLTKYLFHWVSVNNGEYFAINYYPYYLILLTVEKLNLSIYQFSGLLLFGLNLVAGFGIYRLCLLMFPSSKKYLYLPPIIFYLLTPALFNAPHYLFSYSILPWIAFPFFKFYLKREISTIDIVVLNLALFFATMELPNPKYLFHFNLIALLIIIYGLFQKQISFKLLRKNLGKFALYLFLSAYIWLPQLYFAAHYRPENYGVNVKNGALQAMANYGVDTAGRIFKLHQDSVFLNYPDALLYSNSKVIEIASFILPLIVFLSLLTTKRKKSTELHKLKLLQVLTATYLFFSIGPNPPLGAIYEFIVTKVSLLAFLRTTAGAVFFLSLFYSLLICHFFISLKRFKLLIFTIFFACVLIYAKPFLDGSYYHNFNNVNRLTRIYENGFKIPEEYTDLIDKINSKKLDAKTFHPASSLTYLNTTWGFFGPVIYNFLYSNINIGVGKIFIDPKFHNLGFLFIDRSIIKEDNLSRKGEPEIPKGNKLFSHNFLDLYEFSRQSYLPHLYLAQELLSPDDYSFLKPSSTPVAVVSDDSLDQLPKTTTYYQDSISPPTIEYSKLTPARYRLLIHNATDSLPLIFSESFHALWKIYIVPADSNQNNTPLLSQLDKYHPLANNETDQPTAEELNNYIQKGWVTNLGDGSLKKILHHAYVNDHQTLVNEEDYTIDFISKKFATTIQNDNLQIPTFLENLNKTTFTNSTHFTANGYANGWLLNLKTECSLRPIFCQKNQDGTYEVEIFLEFQPQNIFDTTLFISLITLFTIVFWLVTKSKIFANHETS